LVLETFEEGTSKIKQKSEDKMRLNLKVFTNKRNGQTAIHLPKKLFIKLPKQVDVEIPKKFLKVKSKW
jgi:hypothetical protein